MNTPKILGLAVSTLLLGAVRPAAAQTILINPMTPTNSISTTASWGYSIQVGTSNLSVTEMGYFTASSSELAAHAMGIWDGSGNMIASAMVT